MNEKDREFLKLEKKKIVWQKRVTPKEKEKLDKYLKELRNGL